MINRLVSCAFNVRRLGWRQGWAYSHGNQQTGGTFRVRPPQLPHPVELRSGTTDPAVFASLFMFREIDGSWEVPGGGTVVDLGANIGLTAAYFAQQSPALRVVAVEPDPENFAQLARNAAPYPNVTAIQAAIWPETTEMEMVDPGLGKWALQTRPLSGVGNKPVQARSLNDILQQIGCVEVALLKIDIEGAEADLFARNWESWLPKVRRILIELHDDRVPDCSRNFYRAISTRRFRQRVSGEKIMIKFLDDPVPVHPETQSTGLR